jgi:hypothetical protein
MTSGPVTAGITSRLVLTSVGGDLAETVALEVGADRDAEIDEVVIAVEAAPINGADQLFAAGWLPCIHTFLRRWELKAWDVSLRRARRSTPPLSGVA